MLKKLKAENGKLTEKLDSAQGHINDLQKLIETMSFPNCPDPGNKSPRQIVRDKHQLPPNSVQTSNRYDALYELACDEALHAPANDTHRKELPANKTTSRSRHHQRRHRATARPSVTVIGDSLARGVAPLVNGTHADAVGYVYPGSTARQINAHIRHIPSSDVTILQVAANNIETQTADKCMDELRQVADNVMRKRKEKTVFMCQVPHRHDKPHLNDKIDKINKYIKTLTSSHRNCYQLTHELCRDDYKPDGLHFNDRGKAKLAHVILVAIRNLSR
jgi:uncharacterized protein YqgV (UPF0045/DUF77 family)